MNVVEIIQESFNRYIRSIFNEETQIALIDFGVRIGFFLFLVLISLIIGRYTPALIWIAIQRFAPHRVSTIYGRLVEPLEGLFRITGTLILVSIALNIFQGYTGLYVFLDFFLDLIVIFSVAWLLSRLFRQFVRVYGIELLQRFGREVDELLLVFETLANMFIGLLAAVVFAQSQDVNLVGLLASLGIGGFAIAFGAQKTLEQLLGTIVLYLDRPFIPGEYIRMPDGLFGRVESIGLRSTKIRTAAKSTLLIVPNSIMANLQIENVTRGKKVMVLLYLDFTKVLDPREKALVEQIVQESTNALFGIDPGSTRITLFQPEDKPGTRARVTFFILGSSENSLQLRKRLLELANENISGKLMTYGIEFTSSEPTVYVESPITL